MARTSAPSISAAASNVFLLRPTMATRAPSARNRRAVARPMPLLPPVIRAVLFASLMSNLRVDASDRMPGRRENVAKHGPSDRAEPGARRYRRRVDQPERRQRDAQREENVRQVAGRVQDEPAAARRDRQPRQVREQRPQHAARALRGEVERHAEPEEAIEGTDGVEIP